MEKTFVYSNKEERQSQIKIAEKQGLILLHDNFDSNWKSGKEPRGNLIFTDTPPFPIIPKPIRDLVAELDEIKTTLADHETRLVKDLGGHKR